MPSLRRRCGIEAGTYRMPNRSRMNRATKTRDPAHCHQAGLARRQCKRAGKRAPLRFREGARTAGARTTQGRDPPSRHAAIRTASRESKRKSLREESRDVSLLPSRSWDAHRRGRALERAGELSQLLRRGTRIAGLSGCQSERNAPPLEETGDGLWVIAHAPADFLGRMPNARRVTTTPSLRSATCATLQL